MEILYPSVEDVIAANKKAIEFIIASEFILQNEGSVPLKKAKDVRFLIDIREGKKTLKEIERWLNE